MTEKSTFSLLAVFSHRPQLCRYDLVLTENTQKTFKPIPC